MRGRRLGDLADHDLARARVAARGRGDQDFLVDAAVVGHHAGDPVVLLEAADQPLGAALQHLDDGAFRTTATVEPGDADQHAIAMQHLTHLHGRQEDIVAATVATQEAEAIRVGQHHAGDQVELLRRRIAAAAVHQQLAVAQHGAQPIAQRLEALGCGQLQIGGEVLGRDRLALLLKVLEDGLAAGDGVFVLAGLALGIGVGDARLRQATARARQNRIRRGLARGRRRQRRRWQVGQPGRRLGGLAARLGRASGRAALGLRSTAATRGGLAWTFAHPCMVHAAQIRSRHPVDSRNHDP